MESEIVQVTFDYSVLTKEQAERTQDTEIRIIGRTQRTIVENGRDLLAVKKDIGHGHFLKWIESLGISEDAAERSINVAKNFGEIPHGAEFSSRVLYLLASSKVPESARIEAKERASSGEEITEEVARRIRDAHKAREQAEQKARQAEEQLSLFETSHQQEIETFTQQIDSLKKEMEQLTKPETQTVEVVPDQVIKKIEQLQAQVNKLTQQRDNLSKKAHELSNDLDTLRKDAEANREQEMRELRIRQEWQKITDAVYKSINQFIFQLPTPLDMQVLDTEDWARLDQVIDTFHRGIEACNGLRRSPSLMIVEAR